MEIAYTNGQVCWTRTTYYTREQIKPGEIKIGDYRQIPEKESSSKDEHGTASMEGISISTSSRCESTVRNSNRLAANCWLGPIGSTASDSGLGMPRGAPSLASSSYLLFDSDIYTATSARAWFTSHRPNPKYFLFHPSNQIFRRMHRALNLGKKDN
jgi:hypothetical protein